MDTHKGVSSPRKHLRRADLPGGAEVIRAHSIVIPSQPVGRQGVLAKHDIVLSVPPASALKPTSGLR